MAAPAPAPAPAPAAPAAAADTSVLERRLYDMAAEQNALVAQVRHYQGVLTETVSDTATPDRTPKGSGSRSLRETENSGAKLQTNVIIVMLLFCFFWIIFHSFQVNQNFTVVLYVCMQTTGSFSPNVLF